MRFTSPRHLHKGSSGAYKASLAAVLVCIAECRSVRVIAVLDASRNLLVLVLHWLLHGPGRLRGPSFVASVTVPTRFPSLLLPVRLSSRPYAAREGQARRLFGDVGERG